MSGIDGKKILLIISGGIAAYKSLELIRLLRKRGCNVTGIVTKGGEQFVTPMSVAALTENPVYTDLWSLKDETEMGHIRLSRECDLILVAPASADMLAKMAHGFASDLASTTLLASDKPVYVAPAMNNKMWDHPATQDNLTLLQSRGITVIGPNEGEMACGEYGLGRMSEPDEIIHAFDGLADVQKPLSGVSALVTSGPTHEPIDPVRFIGNKSSGKQGHAIATALAQYGADVTLVSGPVNLPDPAGVNVIHVQTALEMLEACKNATPCDVAIFAAAVADWSAVTTLTEKIKKRGRRNPPDLQLKENPDILATIARPSRKRPKLVIGFAAETENVVDFAKEKMQSKNCDWIVANNVAENAEDISETQIFGADQNHVYLISADNVEEWPLMQKSNVAEKLCQRICDAFAQDEILSCPAAAE